MPRTPRSAARRTVAPLAGAWIEISGFSYKTSGSYSFTNRRRDPLKKIECSFGFTSWKQSPIRLHLIGNLSISRVRISFTKNLTIFFAFPRIRRSPLHQLGIVCSFQILDILIPFHSFTPFMKHIQCVLLAFPLLCPKTGT